LKKKQLTWKARTAKKTTSSFLMLKDFLFYLIRIVDKTNKRWLIIISENFTLYIWLICVTKYLIFVSTAFVSISKYFLQTICFPGTEKLQHIHILCWEYYFRLFCLHRLQVDTAEEQNILLVIKSIFILYIKHETIIIATSVHYHCHQI